MDDGEDPRWSVEREAFEELAITPKFHEGCGAGDPFFLTVTQTRGAHSHTDVTLWFVLQGDRYKEIRPDPHEFTATRWFRVDDPADWVNGPFDPQMHRFVAKLAAALNSSQSG